MCDGEALRYQRRRMIVRTKWARKASSRVVPQEMFLFLSQQICWDRFFVFREDSLMFILSKRWRNPAETNV